MVRNIRQLRKLLFDLIAEQELLIRDVETGKVLMIENVSVEKTNCDPDVPRYMINCISTGEECVTYHVDKSEG